MSFNNHRRLRLLRLRAIEHQLAATRTAHAQAEVMAMTDIGQRLDRLRDGIRIGTGPINGRELQSRSELSIRLHSAETGLARSLATAAQAFELRDCERIAARVRENRTDHVLTNAARRDEAQRTLREEASRPPRLSRNARI